MQDYGGPVGLRLAIANPERLDALILQNAVAYEDGLGPLWKTRREFWADREAPEAPSAAGLLLLRGDAAAPHRNQPERGELRPDLWTDEFAFLSRPGQQGIQTELAPPEVPRAWVSA
jgi:pimeloyl-ACP methyl ester carboxylesterase